MALALLRASTEGAVAAVVVWLVCRCRPALRPATRTWLWWLVAAKFAVALIVPTAIPLPLLPAPPPLVIHVLDARALWRRHLLEMERSNPSRAGTVTGPARLLGGFATLEEMRSIQVAKVERVWPETLLPWGVDRTLRLLANRVVARWQASVLRPSLGALWALGVVVAVGFGARRWRRVRRILAESRPAPPAIERLVENLAAAFGLRGVPDVRIHHHVTTPLLAGLGRPVIVLPAPALTDLPLERRRLAIAHELAHVQRRDLLLGWVPALVEATFFFHPCAKLAVREYALSRETACDVLVVSRLDAEPAAYGQMLVELGVTQRWRGMSLAGASWSSSMLKRRLAALREAPVPAARSHIVTLALIILAVVAVTPFRLAARGASAGAPPASFVSQRVAAGVPQRVPNPAATPAATPQPGAAKPAGSSPVAAAAQATPVPTPPQAAPSKEWYSLPDGQTGKRIFILVLDDNALVGDPRASTVASIQRFADHFMAPDDLVALLRFGSKIDVLSDFSIDKARLKDALDAFSRLGPPVQPAPEGLLYRNLQNVCGSLRAIQQRKAIVVFGGTKVANGADEAVAVPDTCGASDTGLIFADPIGLIAFTPSSDPNTVRYIHFAQISPATPPSNSRFEQTDRVQVDFTVEDATGQSVTDLKPEELKVFEDGVQQTVVFFQISVGGRTFRNPDGTPVPPQPPPPVTYTLAYDSANHDGGPTYRAIRVETIRPNLHVTARNGYWSGGDAFVEGSYPEDTPDLTAPVVRSRPSARYTADGMRANIQGDVVIEAVVGVDGLVDRARVASSLDKANGLDEAALATVKNWIFTPGELHGEKVPVFVRLIVEFRIH